MGAHYQTEDADRRPARRATANTAAMAPTDIAQARATPPNPTLHSLTMPGAAAAQLSALDGHQEAHGALTRDGAVAPIAGQVEQAHTPPQPADDAPADYLILTFPIALFVVFAVLAALIAWST